jgi:predicted PhzF superfamily epimerase YddE/YHI9
MIATGRYPCTLTIAQGEYVQRPSTLFLNVDQEQNIRVGGDVVEIASGIVNI